jgi:hypothetical protein
VSDGARDLCQRKVELWARNFRSKLAYNCDLHGNCRVLLRAANLRHGTDGFTSPPKESRLRIFLVPKNPTASAGFGTRELGYQRPACWPSYKSYRGFFFRLTEVIFLSIRKAANVVVGLTSRRRLFTAAYRPYS